MPWSTSPLAVTVNVSLKNGTQLKHEPFTSPVIVTSNSLQSDVHDTHVRPLALDGLLGLKDFGLP